jgi:hypothetical protein
MCKVPHGWITRYALSAYLGNLFASQCFTVGDDLILNEITEGGNPL